MFLQEIPAVCRRECRRLRELSNCPVYPVFVERVSDSLQRLKQSPIWQIEVGFHLDRLLVARNRLSMATQLTQSVCDENEIAPGVIWKFEQNFKAFLRLTNSPDADSAIRHE